MRGIWLTVGEWKDLAAQARYNARNLARLCRLSARQLQRQFRVHFGRSPQDWLDEQRIAAAAQLLLSGEPVKKVAFDLGFKQPSHFCRQFKSRHKMTPSEFVLFHMQSMNTRRSQIINVANG